MVFHFSIHPGSRYSALSGEMSTGIISNIWSHSLLVMLSYIILIELFMLNKVLALNCECSIYPSIELLVSNKLPNIEPLMFNKVK